MTLHKYMMVQYFSISTTPGQLGIFKFKHAQAGERPATFSKVLPPPACSKALGCTAHTFSKVLGLSFSKDSGLALSKAFAAFPRSCCHWTTWTACPGSPAQHQQRWPNTSHCAWPWGVRCHWHPAPMSWPL